MNVQSLAPLVRRPRRSASRRLMAAVAECYRGIELLEPRTLLSGTLSYSVPDAGNHGLILSLVQLNSTSTVQLTDNAVVVAQQPLSSTSSVAVTGGTGFDTLMIDFAGGVPVPSGGVSFTGGGATNSSVPHQRDRFHQKPTPRTVPTPAHLRWTVPSLPSRVSARSSTSPRHRRSCLPPPIVSSRSIWRTDRL